MFAALLSLIHKTELHRDQVSDVLHACCLTPLLGHPNQMKNKISSKSNQVNSNILYDGLIYTVSDNIYKIYIMPKIRCVFRVTTT